MHVERMALAAVLLALGASVAPTSPTQGDVYEAGPVLGMGWSMQASSDRPFYREGESAGVGFRIANNTSMDAYGVVGSGGGLGCVYKVVIRNANGKIVWEPGFRTAGGKFRRDFGCTANLTVWDLRAGRSVGLNTVVPLVYNNAAGRGKHGAPLPAGAYRAVVDVSFDGPRSTPSTGGGLDPSASVPFVILP